MSDVVHKWYEDKKNVDEMVYWNKGELKKWERAVADFFRKKQKFLILDVEWGERHLRFSIWDFLL